MRELNPAYRDGIVCKLLVITLLIAPVPDLVNKCVLLTIWIINVLAIAAVVATSMSKEATLRYARDRGAFALMRYPARISRWAGHLNDVLAVVLPFVLCLWSDRWTLGVFTAGVVGLTFWLKEHSKNLLIVVARERLSDPVEQDR